MPDREDSLFAEWCRRGDTRALGELFDAAAPRLLKLAIHLVGDAVDAEDLVQATFLTAIERRASVDPSRPVMPWLSGVLAHKAQQLQRRSLRRLDVERLAAQAAEDASRPLERRELDGEVARAIDGLGEPYRAVLVLRLRHGMEPADIAHVLERDPGTVRVQLHRGLEKLRAALPAALATSALLGWIAPRGMAAVKGVVMREATAATAGAATALTIGGLLVGKKTLVTVAVALVLAALALLRDRSQPASGARAVEGVPRTAVRASDRPDGIELVETGASQGTEATPTREVLETAAAAALVARGTVVDAETKLPLAGAHVRSFEPREARVLDLVREAPDLYRIEGDGRLRASTRGDWPLVVARSGAARFGHETVLAFDRPRRGEEPLAETSSGTDGGFALGVAARGAVIECAHDGYATRWRPLRDIEPPPTIELWREREVHGVVIGPDAAPVDGLDLVFTAARIPWLEETRKTLPDGLDERCEAYGAWSVRTDASGRFSARVGARVLWVTLTTPGWCQHMPAAYDLDETEALTILVVRMPVFHFFDAATRAPIEHVRLLGRELSNRYVAWAGEFCAPGGMLTLPGGPGVVQSHAKSTLGFVVWSEGYSAAKVSIPDLLEAGTIDVPMERGRVGAFDGVVMRNSEPVAGAEVALIGRSPAQWGVDADWFIDAVTTASDGSFHLEAPDGLYTLRVRCSQAPFLEKVTWPDRPNTWATRAIAGREPYFEELELPRTEPLRIDLARAGQIEVEIDDAVGVPEVGHVVVLGNDGGRQAMAYTDEHGLARFANLPPGRFHLDTPHVNTLGSWAGGERRDVELGAGAVERVRIEIPANTGPRHARVHARDTIDYSAWRARYDTDAWQALATDGTVPMDLTTDRFSLEVESPDRRAWHVQIPRDAPDGRVIELEDGSGVYRGELLRADGTPRSGTIVYAVPRGASRASDTRVSCTTDERGRFELAGLAVAEHRIRFQTNTTRQLEDDSENELAGTCFLPGAPPSVEGTWLSIRAAEPAELVRVHGVVQRASGERLAGVQLVFECEVPAADGTLLVGQQRAFTHADERGEFELELPRAPRTSVSVYTSWTADGRVLRRTLEAAELAGSATLVVP